MKLTYTTKDGRFSVELEGKTHKDLWRELARFQEVFEDEASGKVAGGKIESSNDIKYRVRKGKYKDEKGKEKEAEYFEKVVSSGPLAGYKKHFGVLDDGSDGLFPKNAPDKDVIYGFNKWHKYNGKKEDSSPRQDSSGDSEGETGSVPF
jgi:hypothetical protein